HPFAIGAELLRGLLPGAVRHAADSDLELRLPARAGRPVPSARLAHAVGHRPGGDNGGAPSLERFVVPAVAVEAADVGPLLDRLAERSLVALAAANGNGRRDRRDPSVADGAHGEGGVTLGPSVEFYAAALRLVRHL